MSAPEVLDIWREVLAQDLRVDDNFFALGGDSRAALEIASRIESELGARVDPIDIMRCGTVAKVVERLVFTGGGATSEPTSTEASTWPATPMQVDVFLAHELGADSRQRPHVLALPGLGREVTAREAFARLLRDHAVLRTSYAMTDAGLTAREHPLEDVPERVFEFLELGDATEADARREVQARFDALCELRWDPSTPVVCQIVVAHLPDDSTLALLWLHHVVADGESASLIRAALLADRGAGDSAPRSSSGFAHYARWLDGRTRSGANDEALAWWTTRLDGVDATPLFPGASTAPSRCVKIEFGPRTEALATMAGRRGTTLFAGLHAVLRVFLAQQFGRMDLSVGSPVSTRDQVTNAGVGPYLNVVAPRVSLARSESFHELLDRVGAELLEAMAHKLASPRAVARSLGLSSLFDVGLTLQLDPRAALQLDAPAWLDTRAGLAALNVSLWFDCAPTATGLLIQVLATGRRFDLAQTQALADAFVATADAVLRQPERALTESLPLAKPRRVALSLQLKQGTRL